jgi:polyhydroxybutyrate depolymerase
MSLSSGPIGSRYYLSVLVSVVLTLAPMAPASASCQTNVLAPGDRSVSIIVGGTTRTFNLHVPPSYTRTRPMPLVVDMHGFTSSATAQAGVSGFRAKSDQAGFLVAWPQGLSNSWNAYGCCGNSLNNNVNDVGFMRALVQQVAAMGNVDVSRVYATGLSNGGSMTHRLACEAADVFAAGAPVSFTLNRTDAQCNPSRPISLIEFHGLNDTTVPYNGGQFQGAQASLTEWSQVNNCVGQPDVLALGGNNRCETFTACDGGVHTALCSLEGTHVLYNTQTALNIANYAWDVELSHFKLPLPDQDGDGIPDVVDNCPAVANADQADTDGNCVGDVCEAGGGGGGGCVAGNTGLLSPSAQAADTGGDGNGFETTATNAFGTGGGTAGNTNGAGDRHRFFNYNVTIPAGCNVRGIEVRLDWRLDSTTGTSSMGTELSWNAGTNWTAAKTDAVESTALHTAVLGSASDTWGRAWTPAELGNSALRVRVTANSTSSFRDFFLDWLPVRITYGP